MSKDSTEGDANTTLSGVSRDSFSEGVILNKYKFQQIDVKKKDC